MPCKVIEVPVYLGLFISLIETYGIRVIKGEALRFPLWSIWIWKAGVVQILSSAFL